MHKCSEAGARRTVRLPASVPSHSPLMQPAADGMETIPAATEIRTPAAPLAQHGDMATRAAPDGSRAALVAQLAGPVRWSESVRTICGEGIMTLAECGPGRVLCGLGRRIERQASWVALSDPDSFDETIAKLEDASA